MQRVHGIATSSVSCRVVLVTCLVLVTSAALRAQTPGELRAAIVARVGDFETLRVPADETDFPQPRLEGGEIDPRFAITPERVRLGRLLFFDPIRSNHIRPELGGLLDTSQTGSCGSCHLGEMASKSGMVVSVSVGGLGRHEMDHNGTKVVARTIMEDVVDVLPTGLDVVDESGEIVLSGSFDAVDAPGRVAPSVIGFAFNNRLLWGGEAGEPNPEGYPAQEDIVRKASMAHRMANPDTSHLKENAVYRRLFERAFPDEDAEARATGDLDLLINLDTQFRAIAAFLRTVITRDTPWDRFLAGDDRALSARARRGAWLFVSRVEVGGANCIACHSGPALNKSIGDEAGLLVEENFHNLGTLEHPLQDLARATLGNLDHHDTGRSGVTGDPADAWQFKTPTLRQARDAAPYFHGGQATTLEEAVRYHLDGIPANPLAAASGTLSPLFTHPRGVGTTGIELADADVDALVEFLDSGLYDPGFVHYSADSSTPVFELTVDDLTYDAELAALGATDGWLPSSLPNGFADAVSRTQLVFVRGNIGNGDEETDIADGIWIVNYLFAGGPAPRPMVAGDVNDDGGVDISDAIWLIGYLFLGGPPPRAPFPAPGQDLTP